MSYVCITALGPREPWRAGPRGGWASPKEPAGRVHGPAQHTLLPAPPCSSHLPPLETCHPANRAPSCLSPYIEAIFGL